MSSKFASSKFGGIFLSRRAPVRTLATSAPLLEKVAGVSDKPATLKRFWKTVNLEPTESNIKVLLDTRNLKTPRGKPVVFEKNQLIPAVALAHEWENQDIVLKAYTLPVTSLYARAVDDFGEQEQRAAVVQDLLRYLQTDSVTFHEDDNAKFAPLQELYWTPIIEWAKKEFDINIKVHKDIMGSAQDPETTEKLKNAALELSPFHLAAFERIVTSSKSFLIGLALVKGQITVEEAAAASHVEVESQIESWGMVEDAHDVDREDIRIRLGSAAIFCTRDPSAPL